MLFLSSQKTNQAATPRRDNDRNVAPRLASGSSDKQANPRATKHERFGQANSPLYFSVPARRRILLREVFAA